jgi:hypothetical protein
MKVIINFGDVRCIVPVGDGNIKVQNLIDLAIERYRKAISKVCLYLLFLNLVLSFEFNAKIANDI